MSMEKVISYVNTNRGLGRKENLNRMYQLLEKLNNPQKNLSFIHITGTNGKGSTSSIFQSVLRDAGLNVGLFTSPHLEVVNERIRINNEYIPDRDFIRIVNQIEPTILELEKELDEKFFAFELLTVVAFIYFQERKPDIVILEAGIGGRLDSTNVIESAEVSIITSIGLDHTTVLGDSKAEIMDEKVQILKENDQLVVGPVNKELKNIALNWAKKVNGKVSFIERKDIAIQKQTQDEQLFTYKDWSDLTLSLLGNHQIENACLVLESCRILRNKGYSISDENIYQGLKKVIWPGRFEKIFEKPLFYVDGAHNTASVTRLVETLEDIFPNKTFHFIVGMMRDKEYEDMINQVSHLAKEFIFISPDPLRGFDVKEVTETVQEGGIQASYRNNIEEVLYTVQHEIPKEDIVIQFGSLYLVGEVKKYLEQEKGLK